MRTKKQLEELKAQVERLTQIIETQELVRLRRDSEELKELKELLSYVKIKVKNVQYFKQDNTVQVRYELPFVNLKIDENGLPEKNNLFFSINALNLINIEDMKSIQKVLSEVNFKKE